MTVPAAAAVAPAGSASMLSPLISPPIAAAHAAVPRTMLDAVHRLQPPVRDLALLHLGWSDAAPGTDLRLPGKGLRSLFSVLAGDMTGGDPAAAVVAGACVELVHESSLAYDDFMDGDRLRRGRPAIWSEHGVPAAILVGTSLFTLAQQVLADGGAEFAAPATARWSRAMQDLVLGQAQDVALERCAPSELRTAEWELMAERKTGSLVGAAMALGALSGGADPEVADTFDRIGRALGVAYQIADDVLAVWGDTELTGKPVALVPSAKLYSLVAVADSLDPAQPLDGSVGVRELLEGTPAREHSIEAVRRLSNRSLELLADCPDVSGTGEALRAIISELVERSW